MQVTYSPVIEALLDEIQRTIAKLRNGLYSPLQVKPAFDHLVDVTIRLGSQVEEESAQDV